jgi:hypothetical protein
VRQVRNAHKPDARAKSLPRVSALYRERRALANDRELTRFVYPAIDEHINMLLEEYCDGAE